MTRRLPSLKALLAFEAVARHLSFTRAAAELGVTQGAVSRQVLLLEEDLGVRLLERGGRTLSLSREAERYMVSLSAAFDSLEHASQEINYRKVRTERLSINILPSLSHRWLIPLLNDFRRTQPGINVRLAIGDGPVDFSANSADIAIRAAPENLWKRLHAEPLMGEELLPAVSPALLPRPLTSAKDLLKLPLLQHSTRPDMWMHYLRAMGVRRPEIKHELGFEHFFMLIEAASDGLGVALIPRFLMARELKRGRLIIAHESPYQSPYKYYFICPKRSLDARKVRLFRTWLLGKTSA